MKTLVWYFKIGMDMSSTLSCQDFGRNKIAADAKMKESIF
jgi:hypothetical protein